MLTPLQSTRIAKKCLSNVAHVPVSDISVADTLETHGITTEPRLNDLRSEIVHGADGVKSKGHKMKSSDLSDIATDSTVRDVSRTIKDSAEPIG